MITQQHTDSMDLVFLQAKLVFEDIFELFNLEQLKFDRADLLVVHLRREKFAKVDVLLD